MYIYNITSTICLNNIDMFYSKLQYEADNRNTPSLWQAVKDWRNFAVPCGSEKSPGVKVVSCWEHLYHKTLSPNPQPLTFKVLVDILLISGHSWSVLNHKGQDLSKKTWSCINIGNYFSSLSHLQQTSSQSQEVSSLNQNRQTN